MNQKTGILLINLGTPDAPEEEAVRDYLQEFLSDPLVIDYPRWFWNPLLNKIILKTRPPKSAALYKKIWNINGSPIVLYTESISAKLNLLRPDWQVAFGMRYGNPSLQRRLKEFHESGVEKLIVCPLFPQFSTTTSLTAIQAVKDLLPNFSFKTVTVIDDYHDHPAYIEALAKSIEIAREQSGRPERFVFSFHSIPQRYILKKNDPYLSHCQKTVSLVAQKAGLLTSEMDLVFQSKFGPERWLSPFLNHTLSRLGENGCESVQVICPGFAADCLETLEEVAGEGKDIFQEAGGGKFQYIPALNDSHQHINALCEIIEDSLKPFHIKR